MSNWNLGHFTIEFSNSHQIHLVSDIISSKSIQITQATCTVKLPKRTCQTLVKPPFLWLCECDFSRLLDCYHWYWTLKLRSFPRNWDQSWSRFCLSAAWTNDARLKLQWHWLFSETKLERERERECSHLPSVTINCNHFGMRRIFHCIFKLEKKSVKKITSLGATKNHLKRRSNSNSASFTAI